MRGLSTWWSPCERRAEPCRSLCTGARTECGSGTGGLRNRTRRHSALPDGNVASIDLSRRDIGRPYGAPRYINAATLKSIAGGRTFDRLLKRTESGWEFVPNDTRVDLMDSTQEFRLGKLTIVS